MAFFRQFFKSVTKVDYLTMRRGFINAHLSPNTNFNFHKYIKRSLEDDFKVVVGISPPLWLSGVIILLLEVYGWYAILWISAVPLVTLLIVGMKLELIIMEMAKHIQENDTVVKGAPIIEPSNTYFWFNRPQWVLYLIHLTLFQNAFQLAYFLWTWASFGLKSCVYDSLPLTIIKILVEIVLQFTCSYITFPLYALVTQMGSHMKKSIFEEQTAKALTNWHNAAKEKRKQREATLSSTSETADNTPIRGQWSLPMHCLFR